MSFIQSKSFDYQQFAEYLANAEETNQWSNYGWTVKELEKRAKQVDSITNQLKESESEVEDKVDVNYIG